MCRVTRNGGRPRLTRQEWLKYGALFVLAVAAFGVAALALTNPRGAGEPASPLPARSAAAPTAAASAAPTPTPAATASGTATAAASRLRIELPAKPVFLILGDSYTAGTGADREDQGWAYVVARALGYPTNIDGVGGTGFAWGGGPQDDRGLEYEVRLREISRNPRFVPNVLILQGGQNDSELNNPDELKTATAQTIDAARRFWPGVQVLVLGPSAPQPLAEELRGANTAVRAGAAAANAPFIDAYEAGWFTRANSPGFDADGAHPNTAGHAYLADKFLAAWAALTK
ncbi:SGNH/GDSL hydrolase family protein [Pseudarthrobacter sulfonivorans]|uniref:SGNH/GDSL hydrolase family protein n=1 Tax=Pseudarthrobacter sulfonivorans TaxID=121292 RepID=UPI00168ABFF6|nr:SGNH/GDSL hydrolase family protein [Pseudarthrobacter sulfonivorans]